MFFVAAGNTDSNFEAALSEFGDKRPGNLVFVGSFIGNPVTGYGADFFVDIRRYDSSSENTGYMVGLASWLMSEGELSASQAVNLIKQNTFEDEVGVNGRYREVKVFDSSSIRQILATIDSPQ